MMYVCVFVATTFGCLINDVCLCFSEHAFGCLIIYYNIFICPVCFSGYDFGYMIRILSGNALAVEERDFFCLLRLYFQNIYDVKYLMKSCKNLKGGLQEVADQLEVSGL